MTPTVLSIFIVCGCMASFMLLVIGHGLRQRYRAKRARLLRKRPKEEVTAMNWKVSLLLALAMLLVAFSFVAPVVMTKMEPLDNEFDFSWTGQVGDTVGGLMNPFIALAGVIVTGLAFYMQYEANLQQRRIFREQQVEDRRRFEEEMMQGRTQFQQQLERDRERFDEETRLNREQLEDQLEAQEKESWLQQFEYKFYEMLRLHKDNVNEMEMPAKRSVKFADEETFEPYVLVKRNVFGQLKKEMEEILSVMEELNIEISGKNFEMVYNVFFWGVVDQHFPSHLKDDFTVLCRKLLKRREYQYIAYDPVSDISKLDIPAYRGHSGFLGHYYRHLYMMVKFVANQPEKRLKFKQKRIYLKVLRMQLSNNEQAMLFYNWLGGYGENWQDDQNSFFVDYKMIHNLWYKDLFDCELIKEKIEMLKRLPTRRKKGELFEIDEKKTDLQN